MKPDTKIYSDFIKRNNIKVSLDYFTYNDMKVLVQKDDDGMWYADQDDKCHTKKAAIYWYLKNHTDLK